MANRTRRTREEAKARVLADYHAIAGKTVLARCIIGYFGNDSHYEERYFDPPVEVIVSTRMRDDDLLQDHYDWIDPVYDVVAVNPSDFPATSWTWIDGRPWSYGRESRAWEPSGLTVPAEHAEGDAP
jgi:hypothetical protein